MFITVLDETYEISRKKEQLTISGPNETEFELNLKEISSLKVEHISFTCIEYIYKDGGCNNYVNKKTIPVFIRYDDLSDSIVLTCVFGKNTLSNNLSVLEFSEKIEIEDFVSDVLSSFLLNKNKRIIDGHLNCINNAILNIFKQINDINLLDVFTYKDQLPFIFKIINPENELIALAQMDYSMEVPIIKLYSCFSFQKVSTLECVTPFLKYGINLQNIENLDINLFSGLLTILYINTSTEKISDFKTNDLICDIDQLKKIYSLKVESLTKKSKLVKIGL